MDDKVDDNQPEQLNASQSSSQQRTPTEVEQPKFIIRGVAEPATQIEVIDELPVNPEVELEVTQLIAQQGIRLERGDPHYYFARNAKPKEGEPQLSFHFAVHFVITEGEDVAPDDLTELSILRYALTTSANYGTNEHDGVDAHVERNEDGTEVSGSSVSYGGESGAFDLTAEQNVGSFDPAAGQRYGTLYRIFLEHGAVQAVRYVLFAIKGPPST